MEPGKWKHGPKPAQPLLLNFEPHPYHGTSGRNAIVPLHHQRPRQDLAVGQKYVPKLKPWQMETWTKTCGPYPGGLILTHTHLVLQLLDVLPLFQLLGGHLLLQLVCLPLKRCSCVRHQVIGEEGLSVGLLGQHPHTCPECTQKRKVITCWDFSKNRPKLDNQKESYSLGLIRASHRASGNTQRQCLPWPSCAPPRSPAASRHCPADCGGRRTTAIPPRTSRARLPPRPGCDPSGLSRGPSTPASSAPRPEPISHRRMGCCANRTWAVDPFSDPRDVTKCSWIKWTPPLKTKQQKN